MTGAQVFATYYQLDCQEMLTRSLDELAGSAVRPRSSTAESAPSCTDPAAEAAVLAEATAVAAAAEERLAAEIHEGTVRAATRARDAVLTAAATVAQAAEDARRARAVADALAATAADDVTAGEPTEASSRAYDAAAGHRWAAPAAARRPVL